MNAVPRFETSKDTVGEHATRYETLRGHALGCHGTLACHGLAVLRQQGMAAWMEAWSRVPAPRLRSPTTKSPHVCTLPPESNLELVRLLAAMTLGHVREMPV